MHPPQLWLLHRFGVKVQGSRVLDKDSMERGGLRSVSFAGNAKRAEPCDK